MRGRTAITTVGHESKLVEGELAGRGCAGLGGAWINGARAEDATKPLVIGMELNYPPFEMTDALGKPAGVGVDMAHALGEYLHRRSISRTCRLRD